MAKKLLLETTVYCHVLQMTNATIRKVAPHENEADDDDGQNTTHSGSDGGGPPAPGADAKILKKPGLGKLL